MYRAQDGILTCLVAARRPIPQQTAQAPVRRSIVQNTRNSNARAPTARVLPALADVLEPLDRSLQRPHLDQRWEGPQEDLLPPRQSHCLLHTGMVLLLVDEIGLRNLGHCACALGGRNAGALSTFKQHALTAVPSTAGPSTAALPQYRLPQAHLPQAYRSTVYRTTLYRSPYIQTTGPALSIDAAT